MFKKVEFQDSEQVKSAMIESEQDIKSDLFQATLSRGCEFSTLEFGLKGRLLYNKTDIRAKINKMSIGRSTLLKQ
jgi:hypothetical protein